MMKTVMLWNASSGELLHTLNGHKDRVYSVMYSPTGETLASGGGDGKVKIWDASSGELLHTLNGHKDRVFPSRIAHQERRWPAEVMTTR